MNRFLVAIFFTGLFSIRFLVEFVKESQGGFENIFPIFSTGQWLSIPFIVSGLTMLSFYVTKYKKRYRINE